LNLKLMMFCCELLTIFYLYKVLCSKSISVDPTTQVVNCLQFFIFTRFFAVSFTYRYSLWLLWIAYNFLSLQGSLQFQNYEKLQLYSCELLTIFYLYKVLCSFLFVQHNQNCVVNCLQFFIFTRFFAVLFFIAKIIKLLWIAYNFLSLQGSLQFIRLRNLTVQSCELLTIFYLYKVLCSGYYWGKATWVVVNCLQFFIFTRFFAVMVQSSI